MRKVATGIAIATLAVSMAGGAQAQMPSISISRPCDASAEMIVRVLSVRLIGISRMAPSGEARILANLKEQSYDACTMEASVADIVRTDLQEHGYFLAKVFQPGIVEMEHGDGWRDVALTIRVTEGAQYRAGQIQFSGSSVFGASELHEAFAVREGDLLDMQKVQRGLESLRQLYARRGYMECVPALSTEAHEIEGTVAINVRLNEGPQYIMRSFRVNGLDAETTRTLLADWTIPAGRHYNARLLDTFLFEHRYRLPGGSSKERNAIINLDRESHAVDITLTFESGLATAEN